MGDGNEIVTAPPKENDEENNGKKECYNSISSVIDPEILEDLPPEARKKVEIAMLSMRTHRFGPLPNPLLEKITDKHIEKVLDLAEKDGQRAFDDICSSRRYRLFYVIILSSIFIFCTVYFMGLNKEELYKELIKLAAVYLGGLGSGYGIKNYLSKDQ